MYYFGKFSKMYGNVDCLLLWVTNKNNQKKIIQVSFTVQKRVLQKIIKNK